MVHHDSAQKGAEIEPSQARHKILYRKVNLSSSNSVNATDGIAALVIPLGKYRALSPWISWWDPCTEKKRDSAQNTVVQIHEMEDKILNFPIAFLKVCKRFKKRYIQQMKSKTARKAKKVCFEKSELINNIPKMFLKPLKMAFQSAEEVENARNVSKKD